MRAVSSQLIGIVRNCRPFSCRSIYQLIGKIYQSVEISIPVLPDQSNPVQPHTHNRQLGFPRHLEEPSPLRTRSEVVPPSPSSPPFKKCEVSSVFCHNRDGRKDRWDRHRPPHSRTHQSRHWPAAEYQSAVSAVLDYHPGFLSSPLICFLFFCFFLFLTNNAHAAYLYIVGERPDSSGFIPIYSVYFSNVSRSKAPMCA